MFAQQKIYSVDQLREDLNFLHESIIHIHPNPHTRLDANAYQQLFDSLNTGLTNDLNRTDFLFHLAPLITNTEDGHLNITFGKKRFLGGWLGRKKRQRNTRNMPLAIRRVGAAYLVAGNLSLDTLHFLRGTAVLAIDQQPTDSLVQQISQFSGGSDGPSIAGRIYWTLRFLPARYRHFYGDRDTFILQVQAPSDSVAQEVPIAALSVADINGIAAKRYGGKSLPTIDFSVLDDSLSLGRLDIRSFTHPKDFYNWRFSRKLKKAFRAIRKQKIQHLILDVRGNGGGGLNNAALVGRYLLEESFRLGKAVSVNAGVRKNKRVKLANRLNLWWRFKFRKGKYQERKRAIRTFKPKKKWRYDGPVYLLTDAGSFSATANLAAKLKSLDRVEVVGEATGGGYFMDFGGFFQYLTLPNTQLRFRLPLIQYINDVQAEKNQAAEILPDYPVARTQADFIAKKDTVVEWVKEQVKQKTN